MGKHNLQQHSLIRPGSGREAFTPADTATKMMAQVYSSIKTEPLPLSMNLRYPHERYLAHDQCDATRGV